MSREARQYSQTGLYHVLFRGMNHCHLFEEDKDYDKLLEILIQIKNEMGIQIHAYCLMSNHVHILIEEAAMRDITKIMRKLLTKYAGWFNRKYKRSGSLIANRYKSKPIEANENLISLVRYIHQNPIKAGIVEKIEKYKWSSYKEYLNETKNGLTTTDFILEMICENKSKAKEMFKDLHKETEKKDFNISDSKRKTEEEARQIIIDLIGGKEPHEIGGLPKLERNGILGLLKGIKGLSIRQIERITGIPRGIIQKI